MIGKCLDGSYSSRSSKAFCNKPREKYNQWIIVSLVRVLVNHCFWKLCVLRAAISALDCAHLVLLFGLFYNMFE